MHLSLYFSRLLKVAFLAVVGLSFASLVAFAAPPSANPAPPLTTSATPQIKQGGLTVGSLDVGTSPSLVNILSGGIIANGLTTNTLTLMTGCSTSNPCTGKVLTARSDGTAYWADPATGGGSGGNIVSFVPEAATTPYDNVRVTYNGNSTTWGALKRTQALTNGIEYETPDTMNEVCRQLTGRPRIIPQFSASDVDHVDGYRLVWVGGATGFTAKKVAHDTLHNNRVWCGGASTLQSGKTYSLLYI